MRKPAPTFVGPGWELTGLSTETSEVFSIRSFTNDHAGPTWARIGNAATATTFAE